MFAASSSDEDAQSDQKLELASDSGRNVIMFEIVTDSEVDFDKRIRETMRNIFQPENAWYLTEQQADEISNDLLRYLDDNPIDSLYDP